MSNSTSKPYVYVLVRGDLSPEQTIVQASHAALEAGFMFNKPAEVSSVIICKVSDRTALEEASARLESHGIDHHLFFEPDFEMGFSALATRPLLTKAERYKFKKYPLFSTSKEHAMPA